MNRVFAKTLLWRVSNSMEPPDVEREDCVQAGNGMQSIAASSDRVRGKNGFDVQLNISLSCTATRDVLGGICDVRPRFGATISDDGLQPKITARAGLLRG